MCTFDPGFGSTASCESSITYIDGAKGVLLYRGCGLAGGCLRGFLGAWGAPVPVRGRLRQALLAAPPPARPPAPCPAGARACPAPRTTPACRAALAASLWPPLG